MRAKKIGQPYLGYYLRVRYRTPHTATQNIHKKERQQRKLSVPVLNNSKPKLGLSYPIIYILFHLLKKPTS